MGRLRKATLSSALITVVCGIWFVQTVFWPSGGSATDLRPVWPIVVAIGLLAATWVGTIWLTAMDAYWRLKQDGGRIRSQRG